MMVRVPSNGEITRAVRKGSPRFPGLYATRTGLLVKWAIVTQISVFWRKCSFGLEPWVFTVGWAWRHPVAPD